MCSPGLKWPAQMDHNWSFYFVSVFFAAKTLTYQAAMPDLVDKLCSRME
jgi:hypothetical protein